jgi:hypothetical protein
LSKWSDFLYAKQRVYRLSTCELNLAPIMGVVSLAAIGRLIAMLSVSLAVLGLALPVAARDRPNEEAVTVALNEADNSAVNGVAMLSATGGQTDVAIRLTEHSRRTRTLSARTSGTTSSRIGCFR